MDEIDELQLQRYREMTGEQRLRIGLGLFESSVEIARQAVRDRFPMPIRRKSKNEYNVEFEPDTKFNNDRKSDD